MACDIKICYSKPQTGSTNEKYELKNKQYQPEKETAAMNYSQKIAERLWNMPDKLCLTVVQAVADFLFFLQNTVVMLHILTFHSQ